nr:uncharacterized protein LOC113820923 [Penaeus vannamei]
MVPRTVADQTSAQMAAITAKYRALLQDQARMKENHEQGVRLEAEVKQLLEEREQLSQQLESAREKVHSLQASLNHRWALMSPRAGGGTIQAISSCGTSRITRKTEGRTCNHDVPECQE